MKPGNWKSRLVTLDLGPVTAPGSSTLELYVVDSLEEVIDRDSLLNSTDVPDPPYWALPWIGARAIARLLLNRPPSGGTRVLDLGCGLGLAGTPEMHSRDSRNPPPAGLRWQQMPPGDPREPGFQVKERIGIMIHPDQIFK